MRRSTRYGWYADKWQTVNWRKAKRLYRYERRFYSKFKERHGRRGYLAIVPGTSYAACTVYSPGVGDDQFPIETQIKFIGDDPNFTFFNPDDYPGLPSKLVEQANARHRATYRAREALSRECDAEFYFATLRAERVALKRMAISDERRSNPGNVVIDEVGGFMQTPDVPSGTSQAHFVAELVAELMQARSTKDFTMADAIKREIIHGARASVLVQKDGVEFILDDWITVRAG